MVEYKKGNPTLAKVHLTACPFLLLIVGSSPRYKGPIDISIFFKFQYDPNIYFIDLKTRALNLDKLS